MREFTVELNPALGVPQYEQLAAHIIGAIRAGRFAEGEKLPSVRALCLHLGISRSTVDAAYQILAAEGYIDGRERSGNYILPYERGPQAEGTPVMVPPEAPVRQYAYRFSSAEVDTSQFPYRAWAKLYKGVVEHGSALLQRGHTQGDAPLRYALADFLHQYRGVVCSADQLVMGAGVDQLMSTLLILLGPSAVYALEDPGYPATYRTVQNSGRAHRPVPLDASGMDISALADSGANVAYVTPSHQFPTGVTMPAGRRAKLLAWAAAMPDRYIIEDDYDSEFRHTTRPIPAMQGTDPRRVIYIGTFNRSIAPAIRAAYMVLPPELLIRFRAMFGHATCAVSRFEQQTLAGFIAEGHYQRHLRRMAGVYRRRRDALVLAMGGIEDVVLTGHEAGLHCLLMHGRLSERELIDRAASRGVRLHGLSEYAHAHSLQRGALVMGYGGMGEDDIPRAVALLREAWRD